MNSELNSYDPSNQAKPKAQAVVEQLELELFPGESWGGYSPRGLTRAAYGLIFKTRGVKSVSDFVRDPYQFALWPSKKRPPLRRVAPSARLLIPLPEKRDGKGTQISFEF